MPDIIKSKNIFEISQKIVRENNISSCLYNVDDVSTPQKQLSTSQDISPMIYGGQNDYQKTISYLSLFSPDDLETGSPGEYHFEYLGAKISDYARPSSLSVTIKGSIVYGKYDTGRSHPEIGDFQILNNQTYKPENVEFSKKIVYNEFGKDFNRPIPTNSGNSLIEIPLYCKVDLGDLPTDTDYTKDFFTKGFICKVAVPVYIIYSEGYVAAVTNFSFEVYGEKIETKEKEQQKYSKNSGGQEFLLEKTIFSQNSTIYTHGSSVETATENLAKNVVENYKNGKETAVIRCSVPEDLSVFEIGDEVIPMVYGADGKDRPMSRYKDGADKIFNVVGTKFIYDGAVWQELTLQEKTQSV